MNNMQDVKIRRSEDRGRTQLNWLDGRHTFSFGRYQDPAHLRFHSLLVINEDRIAPSGGFATHAHDNMEILTYVLSGSLSHKDSMGNESVISAGEIQRMRAGTGVTHSEFNPSNEEETHLLQIWIEPSQRNLEPGYEQSLIPKLAHAEPTLLAAPKERGGLLSICQNALVWLVKLDGQGSPFSWHQDSGRHLWLQVTAGSVHLDNLELNAGDALSVEGPIELDLESKQPTAFLLFDLP